MATFTWTPDFGASGQRTSRVRIARFGDGYEQRVGDGINTIKQTWQLQFLYRTDTERDAILSFLSARGGVEAFDWTPPTAAAAIRVVCREWNETAVRYNQSTITASFEQVFEP